MSQHESLRNRFEQHNIKNNYSKIDDNNIKTASEEMISILSKEYPTHTFTLKKSLSFSDIETFCGRTFNIDYDYSKRKLLPDGGVIWMDNKYPVLITEAKRQGTNNERALEGKARQATGNAIERLGKNLTGIKCLYERENILPFICFCWGCDFDKREETVRGKLYTLNSFYEIDKLYIEPNNFYNKPCSILTKPDSAWTVCEMMEQMYIVAISAIEYFLEENK